MKLVKNKILFEEYDVEILHHLKQMNEIDKQMKILTKKKKAHKGAGYSIIELFLAEKGVEWSNMIFHDEENYVELENKDDEPRDLMRLLMGGGK